MRFKEFYLTEAALKPLDLNKPGKQVPIRGLVLVNKINNKEPFEMMDGSTQQLRVSDADLKKLKKMVRDKDFSKITKSVKLLDTSGKEVRLSQIKKNEEFGSSTGQGAGAAKTAVIESAAAIMAAYFVKNKITKAEKCQELFRSMDKSQIISELAKVSSNYNVTNTLEEVADMLVSDPSWLISSCRSSEAIMKELKPRTNSVFHRGSKTVDEIYKYARKLLKDAGYIIGSDKWNPADIWMIDESSNVLKELEKANNILDFNRILAESVKKGKEVVGISLKKIGNKYPDVKWFNLDKDELEKEIGIDEIKPKVYGNVSLAKDIMIIDNSPKIKMVVRDFANRIGGPVTGELQGKLAAGGKVGFNVMINWLQQNVRGFNIKIYKKNDILKGNDINPPFIDDMIRIINQLKRKKEVDTTRLKRIKTKADVIKAIDEIKVIRGKKQNILDVAARLSSKILSFQIALHATDDFFDYVNSYASSNIKDISAPFIKIGK